MESVFVLRLTSIGVSGQFELGQGLRQGSHWMVNIMSEKKLSFLKSFPSLEKIPNSKQKLTLFLHICRLLYIFTNTFYACLSKTKKCGQRTCYK